MFCGLISPNESLILYFARIGKRKTHLRFVELEANWANFLNPVFKSRIRTAIGGLIPAAIEGYERCRFCDMR